MITNEQLLEEFRSSVKAFRVQAEETPGYIHNLIRLQGRITGHSRTMQYLRDLAYFGEDQDREFVDLRYELEEIFMIAEGRLEKIRGTVQPWDQEYEQEVPW